MVKRDFSEAAKYFESIFDVANAGIVIVDQDSTILRINPAFTKIFGYQEDEILGKPFYILSFKNKVMHKSSSHIPLYRFYSSEKTSMEYRFFDKQGHDIPIRFRSVIIKDKHGQPKEAVGILEQMLELTGTNETGHSLTEKVWEAQQNFENILENSPDAILICDNTGNIMMANKAFSQMLNYAQEEVIGKFIVEFTAYLEGTYATTTGEDVVINEKYVNDTGSRVAELFEKGYIQNWETYFVRKDKVHVPVEATLSDLKDKGGERRGSIVILRDIAERKKAEKEIRESKEFLENVFQTSADAIVITDASGNIVMINDVLEKMVGYTNNELLGKHSSILVPPDKYLRAKIIEDLKILFREGRSYGYETNYQRKDKQIILIECNQSLMKDREGDIIGSVNIIRDVTEKKEIEGKLIQAEKLKSLGELAGGVAHDFNNVLAAILGRAQLLKMGLEPPSDKKEKRKSVFELKECLEVIENAAKDGAETVRRIQEFARRRADDKNFETVDINELLNQSLEFTRVKWKNQAEKQGIKINIQKELSPLPSSTGCASELREVFTNLINNAVDAMPNGGHIKIKTFKKDNFISVEIVDTGVGIPKTIRDKIFDPFFTTKGLQSTGLGMSVSYGIINRHQGTISVDSVEGKGTTFTITFPILEKGKKEEKVNIILEEQRKARILVIEDQKEVRDTLTAILKNSGHEVEVASDGRKGIELFEKKEFDLVLTDLGMPEMSGWQVAEKVKSINGRIPVAIITGWNIEMNEREMKNKWVDLIIYKPFEVNQVLRLVQEGMILRDRFKAA